MSAASHDAVASLRPRPPADVDPSLQDGSADALGAFMASLLGHDGLAVMSAPSLRRALGIDEASFAAFATFWDDLTLDEHMKDGGTYRFRRYAELRIDAPERAPRLCPHGPYRQSTAVNPLNGGIDRLFDPIPTAMIESAPLRRFLAFVAAALDRVEGLQAPWRVRLHPYRIVASEDRPGKPAPEGPHRDGVDFVMTLMLGRSNVLGGESSVLAPDGALLWHGLLERPMELLIVDDRRVLHDVDVVYAGPEPLPARRDVLVVAFDRPPAEEATGGRPAGARVPPS